MFIQSIILQWWLCKYYIRKLRYIINLLNSLKQHNISLHRVGRFKNIQHFPIFFQTLKLNNQYLIPCFYIPLKYIIRHARSATSLFTHYAFITLSLSSWRNNWSSYFIYNCFCWPEGVLEPDPGSFAQIQFHSRKSTKFVSSPYISFENFFEFHTLHNDWFYLRMCRECDSRLFVRIIDKIENHSFIYHILY